jgi:hypothetical protein
MLLKFWIFREEEARKRYKNCALHSGKSVQRIKMFRYNIQYISFAVIKEEPDGA